MYFFSKISILRSFMILGLAQSAAIVVLPTLTQMQDNMEVQKIRDKVNDPYPPTKQGTDLGMLVVPFYNPTVTYV